MGLYGPSSGIYNGPGSTTVDSSGNTTVSGNLTVQGTTTAVVNQTVAGTVTITGAADAVQLDVKGFSPQTNSIVRVRNSADGVLLTLSNTGALTVAGLLTSQVNLVVGTGEAGATPAGSVLRAPNAVGTDIAGAALTIAGGQSTGTGAGGSIVFQTAAAGGAGTGVNALATRLTIDANGQLALPTQGATGGLLIGGDVDLYRSAANILYTPDTVEAGGSVAAGTARFGSDYIKFQNSTTLSLIGNVVTLNVAGFGGGVEVANGPFAVLGETRLNQGANAQRVEVKSLTELLTIAAAPTSATTIQIPANVVVLAVSVRTTVVIPTAATYTVTGTTSGTTFNTVAVSTAADTTDKGNAATPYLNGAAQTVTITPNAQPADNTGRVRATIHYIDISPPTS